LINLVLRTESYVVVFFNRNISQKCSSTIKMHGGMGSLIITTSRYYKFTDEYTTKIFENWLTFD